MQDDAERAPTPALDLTVALRDGWVGLADMAGEALARGEVVRSASGDVVDLRVMWCNAAFDACCRQPVGGGASRTVRDLMPWDGLGAALVASLAGGSASAEVRSSPEGRWHEVRAWRDGADGFGLVATDVTERRAEEVRLRALLDLGDRIRVMRDPDMVVEAVAEVLGEVLDVIRVGYGTLDPTGTIVTVRRDWTSPGHASTVGVHDLTAFGTFLDEMADGRLVVVSDTGSDPRTSGDAFEGIGTGAMVNVPFVENQRLVAVLFVNAPGPRAWTQAELSFLRLVAGRLHDAVERRRAEAMLRRRADALERQVAQVADERERLWATAKDVMATVSADGRLLQVNPAWMAMTGWDASDLASRSYLDAVHPDDHAVTVALAPGVLAGEPVVGFVNRVVAKGGQVRFVEWNAVPSGGVFHLTGRDVTASRATEEELRQAQKMEAVGQLTGGLAHDFNNLLAGISGGLDLVRRRIAQGRVAECARYLDMAAKSTARAASLTHRLLAFSRRQALDPRPTDVTALVADLADLIRRTIGPSITLEIEAAEGVSMALVDASQVDNAVLNLCINARDAMPAGGRLRIATSEVTLGPLEARRFGLPQGRFVSVAVADTGSGMPPEVLAKAFDPFFTTKPTGVGTGLGLSMVHGFVTQSSGHVRIDTSPDAGTTVTMLLPVHEGPTTPDDAHKAVMARAAGTGLCVLVVDDEPHVRMILSETLADAGADVCEASDGPEALDVLRSDRHVDLVVTDVGLPGGMDGWRLAREARALRPGLPVLHVTGYGDEGVQRDSSDDAPVHVLTKPFAMDDLMAKVGELTGGRG